ncbi:MAG TPA: hypothetical protein V6D13_09750 [Halomicronema sp.]
MLFWWICKGRFLYFAGGCLEAGTYSGASESSDTDCSPGWSVDCEMPMAVWEPMDGGTNDYSLISS